MSVVGQPRPAVQLRNDLRGRRSHTRRLHTPIPDCLYVPIVAYLRSESRHSSNFLFGSSLRSQ